MRLIYFVVRYILRHSRSRHRLTINATEHEKMEYTKNFTSLSRLMGKVDIMSI